MNIKRYTLLGAAALSVVWLAGCSTPDTRIRDNPEVFARLNPDQQALVRSGQVGLGMDMGAVKIALGNPDSVVVRTDSKGQTQTWHYVEYAYYDGAFLYPGPYWGGGWGGYRHRGGWGGGWGGGYWGGYWGMEPAVQVYDKFKIEFRDGRVSSIAQDLRS